MRFSDGPTDANNTLSCYLGRIIVVLFSTNGVAGQELQLQAWAGLTLRRTLGFRAVVGRCHVLG